VKWYNLASYNGSERAAENKDKLAKDMTPKCARASNSMKKDYTFSML
jgi:hypothetical protein